MPVANEYVKRLKPSREIQSLDPEVDFERIVFLTHHQLFAVETARGLQMALIKTFAAPSVSSLLHQTSEIARRPGKRANDTALMMCEMTENGLTSDRSRRTIDRLNDIHGRFRIRNEDFLFVLSCFLLEPIDYISRYGRRPLTEKEKYASLLHYHGLGEAMSIENLPQTIEAFRKFRTSYEQRNVYFAESNAAVLDATLSYAFVDLRYSTLKRIANYAFASLLRPSKYLTAFGLETPNKIFANLVRGLFRLRGMGTKLLPEPTRPRYARDYFAKEYPANYAVEELGVFAKSAKLD